MLAAMPFLAHADDMSYRYFQVGYMETNVDGLSENPDGFATRGSFGFAKNYFLFTEYSQQELSGLEVNQLSVGLGGHYGLTDNLDLVGRAGYSKAEVKVSGLGSADDDGYLVGAGLRGRMGDHFELEGGVIYQDFGGGSSDTGAEVLARYYFTKRWALAVDYQDLGELSSIGVGVRVSF
jgi:hypothetical protein